MGQSRDAYVPGNLPGIMAMKRSSSSSASISSIIPSDEIGEVDLLPVELLDLIGTHQGFSVMEHDKGRLARPRSV